MLAEPVEMLWYYSKNSTQLGPVPFEELRARLASGEITPSDRVWREGMKDWAVISAVEELRPILPVASGMGGDAPYTAPTTYSPMPYQSVAPTSGLAIASLVCGIVGLVACMMIPGVLSIAAVICGHMAISKIRNSPIPIGGRGMAIAGLATGYTALGLLACILFAMVANV
jgi:GYF domain 2/Domain of unknown function (DUF4190)